MRMSLSGNRIPLFAIMPLDRHDLVRKPDSTCRDHASKTKRRGKTPAPLRWVNRVGRSALADQRRRRGRHVAAGPAHAEPDILRGQVVELEGAIASRSVEGLTGTGDRAAQIEIAIGEF